MEIAKLVLEYLKVLVWPLTVLAGMITFRASIRGLVDRIKIGKLPGGFEVHTIEQQEILVAAQAQLEAGALAEEEDFKAKAEERQRLVEEFAERAKIAEGEKREFLNDLRRKDEELVVAQRVITDLRAEAERLSVLAGGESERQLALLRSKWRLIGEQLKVNRQRMIEVALCDASPWSFSGGVLVIRFPTKTQAEMFSRRGTSFSEPLRDAISVVCAIEVRAIMAEAVPREQPA